jgi:hypothetical protein
VQGGSDQTAFLQKRKGASIRIVDFGALFPQNMV